jgi:hypothetical protein
VSHAIFVPLRRAAAALPTIVLLLLPLRAGAADPSGTVQPTVDARVGIGGAFKVGRWTRLEVALPSAPTTGAHLEVDAPDPDGSAVTYQSEPLGSTPAIAGDASRLGLLFKMGRLDGMLRVRFSDGERTLGQKALRVGSDADADVRAPFRQSVYLVANVQASREATKPDIAQASKLLMAVNQLAAGSAARSVIETVNVDSFEALPTRAEAYDAFDAVFLAERFDLDAQRGRALEQWVRDGGHLVISIGRGGADFAKTSPSLAAWLPVQIQGAVKLRDLSPVESYCRQSSRIMGPGDEPLDAAKLHAPGGQELVLSLAGPLVCRAAYGLGRVTVFALDLNTPQLVNWSASSDLVQKLFDLEESQSRQPETISNRLTQTGITELATQLDGSLDEFTPVSRVTVWHVMGLLAALVLIVGPLDFLLVHKLLRRPELTWITFPLLALVAAGSTVYWSNEAKGNRVLVNQLDVIDVDAGSGWTKAQAYGLVYSPENRRYDLTAESDAAQLTRAATTPVATKADADKPDSSPRAEPGSPRVSWHGRPEATFGGMYRTGGVEISRPAYAASAGDRELKEVPIAVWSTKNLEAQWSLESPGLVESQLESRGLGHLGGTIKHHLPGPIEDWIVAFGHQVFYPRNDAQDRPLPMLPEVPWAPQSAAQRELSGYLTRAEQVQVESRVGKFEEMRTEHADYDPLDHNPLNVLRMVTFHREAGGPLYTGLGNGALRQFDWSPLLDLNHAVLLGRIRRPVTHWKVDGQTVEPDQSFTFVRILLPVKSTRYGEGS